MRPTATRRIRIPGIIVAILWVLRSLHLLLPIANGRPGHAWLPLFNAIRDVGTTTSVIIPIGAHVVNAVAVGVVAIDVGDAPGIAVGVVAGGYSDAAAIAVWETAAITAYDAAAIAVCVIAIGDGDGDAVTIAAAIVIAIRLRGHEGCCWNNRERKCEL